MVSFLKVKKKKEKTNKRQLSLILILTSQESLEPFASWFFAGCARISSYQENAIRNRHVPFEAREISSDAFQDEGFLHEREVT